MPSGQYAPAKRILIGTNPEQAPSRESLASPRARPYFVELTHDAEPAV